MELPKYSGEVLQIPRKLFLFAHTKVGKTSNLVQLPNCLLIDIEDGSEFVPGVKFNVLQYAREKETFPTKVLSNLADTIKEENKKIRGFVYDFIILDTITGIETYARDLATSLYKRSKVGKNFEGTDVCTELEKGAGYDWLRKAMRMILAKFDGLARYSVIYTGHVKLAAINKDGKDLEARDISLTGKLKQIIAAECDAIGYMYRNNENTNQCILSFKTRESDLATGARSEHLRGQEFVISDMKSGKLITHWNKVFLEYAQLQKKAA